MLFSIKIPIAVTGTATNLCIHMRFTELNSVYKGYRKKVVDTLNKKAASGLHTFEPDSADMRNSRLEVNGNQNGALVFHTELMKQNLTMMLKAAKNEIMVVEDIAAALKVPLKQNRQQRRWFTRMVDNLVKTSHVERVNVPTMEYRANGEEHMRTARCLRLINPYTPRVARNIGLAVPTMCKQPNPDTESVVTIGEGGMLADLPFEWQVYRLIALAGDAGLTAADIRRSLNYVGSKILEKALVRITKPADAPHDVIGASQVAEFAGRERRYRYYSTEAFNRMMGHSENAADIGLLTQIRGAKTGSERQKHVDDAPEEAPRKRRRTARKQARKPAESGDQEEEDDEQRTPVSTPRRLRSRQFTADTAIPQAPVPMDLDGVAAPEQDDSVVCHVCKINKDDASVLLCDSCDIAVHTYCSDPPLESIPEGDYFCGEACRAKGKSVQASREPSVEPGDRPATPMPTSRQSASTPLRHSVSSTPTGSAPASAKAINRVTITAVRRRKHLQSLLEHNKILELSQDMIRDYQVLEAQDGAGATHIVDKKTIMRTAKAMEIDGLLKIQTVSLLQMNGAYQARTLLLDPSLDPNGRFVKDYVDMMQDRQVIYRGAALGGAAQKIEVCDIEVERLPDIQRRLNIEPTDSQPSSQPSSPLLPPPILSFEPQQPISDVDYPHPQMHLFTSSSALELSHGPGDAPRFGGRRAERLRTAGMTLLEDHEAPGNDHQLLGGPETEFWTDIAQQYGYICPKMRRAHTLHVWLYKHMAVTSSSSSAPGGPFRDRGIFQSSWLFRELTFDMYLKIIGQRTHVESIDEFLTHDGARETIMIDLPEIVRREVFGANSGTRFRRLLKMAVDILVALGVLRPVSREGKENPPAPAGKAALQLLYPAYRLDPVAPMYDYVVNPEFKLGEYDVTTLDGVEHYWARLEVVCRRHTRKARARTESGDAADEVESEWDPSTSREGIIEVFDEVDGASAGPVVQHGVLAYLNVTRNWVVPYTYTAEQKDILNKHMHSKTGVTPVRNDAVCERLAHEAGLTVARVKAYYSKTEENYLRKAEAKQRMLASRKRNKEKRQREAEEQNDLIEQEYQEERAAKRADRRQERWNSDLRATANRKNGPVGLQREARLVGRRSYRTGAGNGPAAGKGPVIAAASGVEELDGETVPIIEDEDRFQTQYNQAAKRRKANFTKQDDQVLLHGYAILNCYRTQRFSWQPLADVFKLRRVISENRNQMRDICRRRVLLLTTTTTQLDYVNNLSARWPAISMQAVAEGRFTQSEIEDRTPERLAHLINYFIHEATTKPGEIKALVHQPVYYLPKTIDELHKIFRTAEKAATGIPYKPAVSIEDELAEQQSMRTRMSALYSRSLTMLLPAQHVVDAGNVGIRPPTIERIQEHVVVALVKMMLMTPEDRYDSARAFMMLQAFPQLAVQEALTLLCEEHQAIVKIKGSQDRRVPGRGFVLSDKFLHAITGSLPDRLVPQAISFANQLDRRLKEEAEVEFSPFVNGGSMAVLLDALAHGRAKAVLQWPKLVIPIAKMKTTELYDDPTKGYFGVVLKTYKSAETRDVHRDEAGTLELDQTAADGPVDEQLTDMQVDAPAVVSVGESHSVSMPHTPMDVDPPREASGTHAATRVDSPRAIGRSSPAPMDIDLSESIAACANLLYTKLREAGPIGLSSSELSSAATASGYSIREVHEGLKASSLISAVGFDQLRFIVRGHIGSWTIPPFVKPPLSGTGPSSGVVEMSLILDENGKPTPARMWYDINGDEVETTKRACMEATLGHIVQMPGIYESKLYVKLANVMTRVELAEVLQMLVDRRACRRKVFVKPPPVRSILHGMFEDSEEDGFYHEDSDSMSEMKVSCYWAESEWFRKTS
ncbi:Methyl-CpG-binding domain-containing protein 9 [Geranomyces variabilis]|nr:Methyl-CpG-binding domain-containing protein 9 [Geranomyces variabilis]